MTALQNWSQLADTLASLPGQGPAFAKSVRTAGKAYENRGFPAKATTLVESTAHATWRATVEEDIRVMGALAAEFDGDPEPTIGEPDALRAQYTSVRARMRSAVSSADSASKSVAAKYPAAPAVEPQFYVAAHYVRPAGSFGPRSGPPSDGQVELDLRAALDAADRWIEVRA